MSQANARIEVDQLQELKEVPSMFKGKYTKFIVMSVCAFIFYLTPMLFNFNIGGVDQSLIAHLISFVLSPPVYDFAMIFATLLFSVIILGTIIFTFYESKSEFLNQVFKCSPAHKFFRIFGSIVFLFTHYQIGLDTAIGSIIFGDFTGGVLTGLGRTMLVTMVTGVFFLPFLVDFGLIEFVGEFLNPVMKKLFRVPGYSAVDATTSFLGDGTIGIVVTDKLYQDGYYNKKEAAKIATNFSVIGLGFAIVVGINLGFTDNFGLFYGTIALVTVIVGIIMARMPYKKWDESYYSEPKVMPMLPGNAFERGLVLADRKAKETDTLTSFLASWKIGVMLYVGLLPVIIAAGTIGLIIAEHTPFFEIVTKPIVPLYQLLGFGAETSVSMATGTIAGLFDMYLPTIFIMGDASVKAKFIIGVLSFTQLVFLSETGIALLRTKMGFNVLDIIKFYLIRTVFSLPFIIVLTFIYDALKLI
ncbi:YjiH family protein [Acidaminobacter sp. JC074]|uniref:YjiH family protein n=1 Tax=Acidaminobacter sp. JC074 TaxID=2530199 RepID=UPI001F0E667D|nr:nucleoside recognition domain-containing protein [Acidaminobacter sp. JC074]MCH4890121.1 YjiH family protein [Acidaminobacter sp. JC074]